MKIKVLFIRKKGAWRWHVSTMNGTKVGASSEGYAQRIGCTKNFTLLTGFSPPLMKGRATSYSYVATFQPSPGLDSRYLADWTSH